MENPDDSASINSIWDNFGGNIRIRAEERLNPSNGVSIRNALTNIVQNLQVKEYRLNFHGCRIQVSAVILNKVGLKQVDTSRITGKYSTGKVNDLVSDSNKKNNGGTCRGINEFKMGYQPRTN